MLEAEAVVHLSFQFAVAEAVPLLEGEELHHGHGVDVGSASSCALVVVEALDDGSEGLPVYEEVDVGEPVAIFLDVIVGFSEHVISKGAMFHAWLLWSINLTEGLEAVKTEINQNPLK